MCNTQSMGNDMTAGEFDRLLDEAEPVDLVLNRALPGKVIVIEAARTLGAGTNVRFGAQSWRTETAATPSALASHG